MKQEIQDEMEATIKVLEIMSANIGGLAYITDQQKKDIIKLEKRIRRLEDENTL